MAEQTTTQGPWIVMDKDPPGGRPILIRDGELKDLFIQTRSDDGNQQMAISLPRALAADEMVEQLRRWLEFAKCNDLGMCEINHSTIETLRTAGEQP